MLQRIRELAQGHAFEPMPSSPTFCIHCNCAQALHDEVSQ